MAPVQARLVPAVAQHIPQLDGLVPAVAQLMLAGVKQASVVDLHCYQALQLGQAFGALQDQALSCQAALTIVPGLPQHQV